jgi:DNA-binding ferritin-like protein
MFETHYNELALAVDPLAERIRALGFPAPATYSEFARLSSIKETAGVTVTCCSRQMNHPAGNRIFLRVSRSGQESRLPRFEVMS